jgi:phosphatidylglycerol:prolipoprotein diacylglycerol transferase
MHFSHWLGWFYWDPPREAFTVPIINHPVVWYGVLFVTGFILAYFIINPILARFLNQMGHLSNLDVRSWPTIVGILRTSPAPLASQLMGEFDTSTRQQLQQHSSPPLTLELQQSIVDGLNRSLQSSAVSREELQQLFGSALASPKQTAYLLTDRLCWFTVIGTIVGARLGAVFFYDWPYFSQHPIEIFKVWHGGLASHGGALGVMLALFLYVKYIQRWIPQLTFLHLLDFVAIPSALTACFIRLGNFMNQEIVGTPTTQPWGVLFGHPAENVTAVARHPVQLYEAAAYLMIFVILWRLWKNKHLEEQPGALVGLLFIMVFGSRFMIEFWKATQESFLDSSFLQMGQLLSLPFILLGIFLFWRSKAAATCCLKRN